MAQKEPIWLKILRIALGLLFLFSSISKAVDPVNFGITMNANFAAMVKDADRIVIRDGGGLCRMVGVFDVQRRARAERSYLFCIPFHRE